ncbi:hypothetical protein D3C76_1823420 [compost metagenome]
MVAAKNEETQLEVISHASAEFGSICDVSWHHSALHASDKLPLEFHTTLRT